ncbi:MULTISPECIES: response regulator [Vitreoscilla]|uniref:Response regulator n=1 Tax=Vitreoscilla stercoraria TaxID=61 RepID=A0ABY4EAE6_VITST|nr:MULTISPECIES: response regulator [Vitreoscilla]AUZ06422.1 signal transduction response regulator CheY [Vitreoscilla sp. C1]UOO92293.1 response regulator [Vitreoscilla stercoraria]
MAYKLMVVDDSNIIRNRIKRGFNASQFDLVATASNGLEALEEFKKHLPEVITMDLTMPEMDGLECIRNIINLAPDTLILVISALSDKATGIKALELGACGFICKPFTEDELMEALNELVQD